MKKKIVIAGGSGFIGRYLQKRFEMEGYEFYIISSTGKGISWQDHAAIKAVCEDAEMIINLAGKTIKGRFSAKNKLSLVASRISTTENLGKIISQCERPPKIWFNASGAHIYGTDGNIEHNEKSPIDNSFFLSVMAQKWEEAFFKFSLPKTRQIALRISIVLGKGGGVLNTYLKLAKWLLGGYQGSGNQKISWIHLEDFYQILHFISSQPNILGAVNICSPDVINNKQMMASVRKACKAPFGLPAPALGIKIAGLFLGIEPDLILKSMSVSPQKLLDAGYKFKHPKIEEAIQSLTK